MINHCNGVFMMRATNIQQNVKTAEKLGGSNIFATLSLSLSLSLSGTYLQ